LSRRSSVESGVGSIGLGYSGSGYGCGSRDRDRERRDPSSSLSPEDTTGDRRNGRGRVPRGDHRGGSLRRVDSGSISGGEGSSSISPPATGRHRDVIHGVVSKPIDIPVPSAANSVIPPPSLPIPVPVVQRPSPTLVVPSIPPQSISSTITTPTTPTPPSTSGSTTPTSISTITAASSREDTGSLMGRAVSSAKGYFGAFWSSNANGASVAQPVAR